MDWDKVVDIDRALKNVKNDLVGDWFRDPWDWPELDFVAKKRPDILYARLGAEGVARAAKIDVAKENFGIRPAIVMDPIDRLAYQAIVDSLSLKLGTGLPETVYGWRLPRRDPERGSYSPNRTENEMYRRHISTFGAHDSMSGLKTDIVSFFSNIPIDRLSERIVERAGRSKPADRLIDMLASWDGSPRKGLPQRSAASALLANLYLQPLDDALLEKVRVPTRRRGRTLRDIFHSLMMYERILDGGQSARWMDDIWVFRRDVGELRTMQAQIEGILRDLGLDINIAKTAVLEGEDLRAEILNFAHSAAETSLLGDPKDYQPLRDLIDLLIASPESSNRSTFKFTFRRMREHAVDYRLDDLVEVAHRAPHAADAYARLFRDSETYKDLHGWFVKHWKSSWAVSDWSVASLATMFPVANIRKPMRELLASHISQPGGSLAKTSFAASRLAIKDPENYRAAIRAALKNSDHPLERRVLALAALSCGEERQLVKKALKEFSANQVTLEMLMATNFRTPKMIPDLADR
ncbi:MAG: RNA-directed DNA polymerase [Acidimicrobiales bacterium]